jgi:chromosome partitioning protein
MHNLDARRTVWQFVDDTASHEPDIAKHRNARCAAAGCRQIVTPPGHGPLMDATHPRMRRIACCNHKGGVGKTTCAVNLAAGLVRAGWCVLVVDADPQAHLTASLGLAATDVGGLAGVLRGHVAIEETLVAEARLTILAGSTALATLETELSGKNTPQDLLARALAALVGFDVAIIDCPPHLGPLTRQALTAAEGLIVPMTPDFLSMQSLAWLMDTLGGLPDGDGSAPSVLGIVLNRFCAQKRLHREVLDAVREHFPGVPFETAIRENVALAEAPSHGQDIFRYAPKSAGATDFTALCRETARRLGRSTPLAGSRKAT